MVRFVNGVDAGQSELRMKPAKAIEWKRREVPLIADRESAELATDEES